DIYPAPPGQRVRVGRRFARDSEMEDFLATQVRASTAIADAARKGDVACSQALPKDLGEWRSLIEFFLGPFGCGKDLSEISALDFARSSERDVDAFCRQGFGTLLTKLAASLPVQLNAPVTAIEWGRRTAVEVVTARGRLTAPGAIVTASTNVFGADMKNLVRRRHATSWNEEPWVLGAFSAASPGGQSARRVLMEPLNRMYFAGEAVHETLWGTVGGAWESGERAADAVAK